MVWCKKCRGQLEYGLPYWEGDVRKINLYCWNCNYYKQNIAGTIILERLKYKFKELDEYLDITKPIEEEVERYLNKAYQIKQDKGEDSAWEYLKTVTSELKRILKLRMPKRDKAKIRTILQELTTKIKKIKW